MADQRFSASQAEEISRLIAQRAELGAQLVKLVAATAEEKQQACSANDDPWECRESLHEDEAWLAEQVFFTCTYFNEEEA